MPQLLKKEDIKAVLNRGDDPEYIHPNSSNNTEIQKAMEILKGQGFNVVKNGQEFDDAVSVGPPVMLKPDREIRKKDLANGRWYYEENNRDDLGTWIPSVTTQLSSIHKGHGFNAWNRNKGHFAPIERDAKAQQGTHVHALMQRLVEGDTITVDSIRTLVMSDHERSWEYLYKHVDIYVLVLRRYLASFMQFWIEHKPVPVACEYPLFIPEQFIAGRLDLVVKMKKAKNSKKDSLILIDLKTGGKYWTHVLQNSAYKAGWEWRNPTMKIDYIASLYVRDNYVNEPTYDLHYQKDSYNSFVHCSELWVQENKNAKGVLLPSLKKRPPTNFYLY